MNGYNLSNASDINLGSKLVKAVYIGSKKIWDAKTPPVYSPPTAKTGLKYSGNAQTILNSGTSSHGTFYYSLDNSTWSTSLPQYTEANTNITAYWKLIGDSRHNDIASTAITCIIAKVTPTVTAPTAKANLVYTGSAQALANAGSTNWGTLQYSLDNSIWGTSVPTATNANTYKVYYRVVGNSNVNDVEASYITCSIGKATPTYTAPTAKSGLVYSGSAQALLNAGSTSHGTISYSSDGSTWSASIPTSTNVNDNIKVYWKLDGDNNHTNIASTAITCSIAKVTPSVTAPTKKTLTYSGESQVLANAGSTNFGTLQYSLDNSSYSTSIPTGKNAGDYTLYYKVVGDSNINNVEYSTITCTISKATASYNAPTTKTGLIYNNTNQALLNAGSTGHGTMLYSSDNINWSTSIPTGKNVLKYTSYWRIVGDSNHNDKASASIETIISLVTPTVTAPTAKTLTYTGNDQALVNAGSTDWGTLQYSLDGTNWDTAIPTGKNATSYTVYYHVVGNSNIKDVAAASVACSISKANPTYTAPTAILPTYNGSAQNLITAGSSSHGAFTYSTSQTGTFSSTIPTGTTAGDYTAWWKFTGDSNHNDVAATLVSGVKINKKSLTITAKALTITYGNSIATGTGQVTVSGLVSGDSLTAVTLTPSTSNATSNGTITPSGATTSKGIGNYSVTYTTGKLVINTAPGGCTNPSAKTLDYSGSAQVLINAAGSCSTGTYYYSHNNSDWYTDVSNANLKGTNAGTYTRYWKFVGDSNHTSISSTAISPVINKINCSYTAPTAKTVSWTGNDQVLINAGSGACSGCSFLYSNDGSTWYDSISYITGNNAGTYTKYWKFNGGINYNSVGSTSLSPKINKVNPINTPTAKTVDYNGSALVLINAGGSGQGTFEYSHDNSNWYTAVDNTNLKGTNAGTYTRYWRFTGDGNHNNVSSTTISPVINKINPTYTAPKNANPEYTSGALVMITPGSSSHGSFLYSHNGSTWYDSYTNDNLKGTTAGSYTRYWKFNADGNHNSIGSTSFIVTIDDMDVSDPTIILSQDSYVYDGNLKKPIVTLKDKLGQVIDTSEYSVSYSNNINAGTATVTIADAKENGNYNLTGKSKNFSITAAACPYTAPTFKSLFFNNSNLTIINAGTASLGTMKYSLDNSNWSSDYTTIIGNTVKSYTVYYKVDSTNTNYQGLSSTSITGNPISKSNLSVTEVNYNSAYDESLHSSTVKVTSGGWDGKTIVYGTSTSYGNTATSNGAVNTAYALYSATNYTSSVTIYYKITGGTNYNDYTDSVTFAISKKATNSPVLTAGGITTYTGSTYYATAKNGSGNPAGTIYYGASSGSTSYSLTASSTAANMTSMGRANVGTTTIYAFFRPTDTTNYLDSSVTSTTVTISNKATGSSGSVSNPSSLDYKTSGTYSFQIGITGATGTVTYPTSITVTKGSSSISGWTCTSAGVVTAPAGTGAGTYSVTGNITVATTTNYNAVSATSKTWTIVINKINQNAPTATGATVTYGNTATATASGGGGQGSIEWSNGNTLSGSVDSKTTKARWSGNDNYNASAWSNEVTLQITKADPTISVPTAKSGLIYNGSSQTLYNAGSNTTAGSFSYSNGTRTDYGSQTVSWSFTPTDATNYKSKSGSFTGSIGQKPISEITTWSGSGGVYKGSAYSVSATVKLGSTTLVSGTDYTVSGTWSATNVGSYTATITAKNSNYSGTSSKSWSITQADSPVAVSEVNVTYSGSAQNMVTVSNTSGQTVHYSIDNGSWTTDIPTRTNVGTYTIRWYVDASTNYKAKHSSSSPGSVTSIISAKALTITANAQIIQWGNSIATGTGKVSVSGLVSGDSLTSITLAASTTEITTNGTITPSAAATTKGAGNYSITYNTGQLSIIRRVIAIKANNQSVVYGTAISQGVSYVSVSSGSLASGHSITAITLSQSRTTVGSGTITPSAATIKNGTTDYTNKYTINYVTGTLTVTAKALTIKAKDQTITYGSSIATGVAQITATGLVGSDAISEVTLTASRSTAGTGTITPSDTTITNSDCYTVTYTTGTLTVNKKALTITANAQTINYGQSIATGTSKVTVSGLVSGDSLTAVTLTPSTSNATNDGTITPSAATTTNGISNYSVTYTAGKLVINKIDPTYSAPTAKTGLVYNRSAQALVNAGSSTTEGTFTYNLDGGTYSTTIPTATNANTNGYTVGWKFTPNDTTNYNIKSGSISVTIAKATPVINVSPSKRTPTYSGSAQNLLYGGSVKHSSSDSTAVAGTFTYAQGTNAGTYSSLTWSFTPSTGNYNSISGTVSGSTTILKYTPVVKTYPTTRTGLVYSGEPQALYTGGEMIYGQSGVTIPGTWTYDTEMGAGTHYGNAYFTPNDTTNIASATIDMELRGISTSIAKKPMTITAKNQTITYGQSIATGTSQITVTGFITLYAYGIDYLKAVTLTPSTSNATTNGTITPSNASASLQDLSNYDITYVAGTLVINKADASVTTAPTVKTGLVYNGQAQELINAGVASGGTMMYYTYHMDVAIELLDKSSFSASIPTCTNAQWTNHIWYYVKGDGNHNDTAIVKAGIVIIARANRTLSFTTAPSSVEMEGTIEVAATPSAGGGTITYSSSNTSYATVSGNTVTGMAIGTTTITATIEPDGNYNSASASYTLNVTAIDWSKRYLTIEPEETCVVMLLPYSWIGAGDGAPGPQYYKRAWYSLDNGNTWSLTKQSDISSANDVYINVPAGGKVMFKGNLTTSSSSKQNYFVIADTSLTRSVKFKVMGNPLSIYYEDSFATRTSIDSYGMYKMFEQTQVTDASNLALPATTLGSYCYASMFESCSYLTKAPQLPATTMETYCYESMFYNCASLTSVPNLPATTLAERCYMSMFKGCIRITTLPTLPATTLANGCYNNMFYGCVGITSIPSGYLPATTLFSTCYSSMFENCTYLTTVPSNLLPATTAAVSCYNRMFYNCTNLTSVPNLPATTLKRQCYGGMFHNCKKIVTAPVLPASSTAASCYSKMFYNCSSLNYVKALFTNAAASSVTDDWLYGVAATGTFVKHTNTAWSPSSDASGIPSGWTVQTATS